jgi:Glycosyltransferase family 92
MTKPPPPWRNRAYVAATVRQALKRRREEPASAYSWGDLWHHLRPSSAERRRGERQGLPYLAFATLVLNEGRDLREWIEFHLLQGVERFYLYDNGSTDDTSNLLEPYIERGIAELTPWVDSGRQNEAIGDAFSRRRDDVRWLAALDADEFLFCPTGERVVYVLKEYECYPAVAVHWNIFGTSDVERRGPDDDVLETFVRRSNDFGADSANVHVKSIVDPWRTLDPVPPNPHVRPYRVGFAVNEAGIPIDDPSHWPIHCDRLRINHYWTKSKADSLRKVARQWPPRATYTPRRMEHLLDPRLNAVEDRTTLRVRDQLRAARDSVPVAPDRVSAHASAE